MLNPIGFSIYLKHFDQQKNWLETLSNTNCRVFTSLHIPEEFSDSYAQEIFEMLTWLKKRGFYVISDISHHTLKFLNVANLNELVTKYPIDNIRIDFGFTIEDLVELPASVDITINASTQANLLEQWLAFREQYHHQIFVMHNFYPRPETGLEVEQFLAMNRVYKENDFAIMAFIAGDRDKRGPIFDGLPTLEFTRSLPPFLAYRQLLELGVDSIFVGDVNLSGQQMTFFESFSEKRVMLLPVTLEPEYHDLYDHSLQIRIDSPTKLLRITDLRQSDTIVHQKPLRNNQIRQCGDITLDNELYGRYTGEIQLVGKSLPGDEKINTIGRIEEPYLSLFNLNNAGISIKFIQPS